MNRTDKEDFENILILRNLVEADLMRSLLEEEGLTFFIRDWNDVSYSGVFVDQKGYGWLVGRKEDKEEILSIYEDCITREGLD